MKGWLCNWIQKLLGVEQNKEDNDYYSELDKQLTLIEEQEYERKRH